MSFRSLAFLTAAFLLLAACDGGGGGIIAPRIDGPSDLMATYEWELDRWQNGEPVGSPRVELVWSIPSGWQGDPFRVYARRGSGAFALIATVTSCAQGICTYVDSNVRSGETYEYFVAAFDERSRREAESGRVSVVVPSFTLPATPTDLTVTGLDAMSFIRWRQTGAQRFRVLLQVGDTYFDLGETDSQSFLDDRAENGVEHRYLVAAIDTLGHFSRLSAVGIGVPRPDYHAELIYPREVNVAESGFRFVEAPETQDPIISGDSPVAQWRLETIDGVVAIRPLGSTRITQGTFTTALSCGPGAEPDCVDVTQAPAASAFGDQPVAVQSANTHVFRVIGPDSRVHYAKVRVLGVTRDSQNRPVMIFDWAYQLRPDDVRLDIGAAAGSF
jgi:hypothetical protein